MGIMLLGGILCWLEKRHKAKSRRKFRDVRRKKIVPQTKQPEQYRKRPQ